MAKKKTPTRQPIENTQSNKDILVIGQPLPKSTAPIADHICDDYLSIADEERIAKAYPIIIFAPTHHVFDLGAKEQDYQNFHTITYGNPDPDIDQSYWTIRDRFFTGPDWEDKTQAMNLTEDQQRALTMRRKSAHWLHEPMGSLILKAINGATVFLLIPDDLVSWKLGRDILLNFLSPQIGFEQSTNRNGYEYASTFRISGDNSLPPDIRRSSTVLINLYNALGFLSLNRAHVVFRTSPLRTSHSDDPPSLLGLNYWGQVFLGNADDVYSAEVTFGSSVLNQAKDSQVLIMPGHVDGKNRPMSILFATGQGSIVLMPKPADLPEFISRIQQFRQRASASSPGDQPENQFTPDGSSQKTKGKRGPKETRSTDKTAVLHWYSYFKNGLFPGHVLERVAAKTGIDIGIVRNIRDADRKRQSRIHKTRA